jgi:hypothetical protein
MSPPVQQLRDVAWCNGSGMHAMAMCEFVSGWRRRALRALLFIAALSLTGAGILAWQSLDTWISLPIL